MYFSFNTLAEGLLCPITFFQFYFKQFLKLFYYFCIDGNLAPSSAHGPNLFVTAPGVDILSTLPKDMIGIKSGTSMACPHVAGLAALILERNPTLTAKKVREIIARNTKQIGNMPYNISKEYGNWNEYYGYGLIDAYNAVINTPRR